MRMANIQALDTRTKDGVAVEGASESASRPFPHDPPPTRQIIFHIPLTIKRRCGRKQIITPDGKDVLGKDKDRGQPGFSDSYGPSDLSDPSSDPSPSPSPLSSGYAREPLSLAMARAQRWIELIERGEYPNVQALARAIHLDRSYIHRLLRLTLLRPEYVEALLNNCEPGGMSIEKLWEIPEVWEEQGRVFGQKIHLSRSCRH